MNFLSSVILDLAKVLLSLAYFSLGIRHSFDLVAWTPVSLLVIMKLGCQYLGFFLVAARVATKTEAPLLLAILLGGGQFCFSFPVTLLEYFSCEENNEG